MYLAINTPQQISTLEGVLLINDPHMLSQLLKLTGIPSHILMRLHGSQIHSLLLFWQPLITQTSLYASIGPYLKQQRVGYPQIILIVVTENPILGSALRLLP